MPTLKQLLLLTSALFLSTFCLSQSGWTKQKGELYSQLSFSYFQSDKFYTTEGKLFETNEFIQQSYSTYGEYGITNRLTTILNLNFFQANKFTGTQTARGPGNLRLGLKYAISKKIPISIAIEPEIPLTTEDNFVSQLKPDQFGLINQVNLPTSDGEFNVWSTLAASGSAVNGKIWYTGYFSHNLRTKGFSNQLKTGIEVGYKPIDRLYFNSSLSILSNFTDDLNEDVSFIRGEGTQNSSFSIGAGYRVYKNFGVLAEYYQGITFPAEAQNTFIGPLISAGITYSVNPNN